MRKIILQPGKIKRNPKLRKTRAMVVGSGLRKPYFKTFYLKGKSISPGRVKRVYIRRLNRKNIHKVKSVIEKSNKEAKKSINI